jgi:hypothetical protein
VGSLVGLFVGAGPLPPLVGASVGSLGFFVGGFEGSLAGLLVGAGPLPPLVGASVGSLGFFVGGFVGSLAGCLWEQDRYLHW